MSEDKIGGACGTYVGVVGKLVGKIPLEKSRRGWDDSIKMDIR
jgi:hypothetical protein